MSTSYGDATEQMVLEEFREKIDLEEGVARFLKSESPDGIIWTNAGKVIGVEVTSAIRTDDSATNPKDKNKVAIFLNEFGLYDPKGVPSVLLEESFTGDSYMQNLLSKIKERIRDKELNPTYCDFKSRFTKSVLVIYLDDPYLDSYTLERITSQNTFSDLLHLFDEAYLYIRTSHDTSPLGIKHIGGFYLIGKTREA
jgi:hypothetical protein